MGFVDFPRDLPHQLDLLTDALEDPGTDLQAVVTVLVDDLTEAIPSLLGLNLTITLDGDMVTLSTTEPGVPGAAAHPCMSRWTS